mgnify:CR=1 FL=1
MGNAACAQVGSGVCSGCASNDAAAVGPAATTTDAELRGIASEFAAEAGDRL